MNRRRLISRVGTRRMGGAQARHLAELSRQVVEALVELGKFWVNGRLFAARGWRSLLQFVRTIGGARCCCLRWGKLAAERGTIPLQGIIGGILARIRPKRNRAVPVPVVIANRLAAVFTCPRIIAVIVRAAIMLAAIILPVIVLAVTAIAASPRTVGIVAAREVLVVPSVAALGGPCAFDLVGLRRIQDDAVEPFADGHAGTACSFTRGFTRLGPHPAHLPRQTRFHARIRQVEGEAGAGWPWRNQSALTSGGKRCRPCTLGGQFFRSR